VGYQQAPDGHRAALHLPMWGLLYGWHGSLHGPCSIQESDGSDEQSRPLDIRQLMKLLSEARTSEKSVTSSPSQRQLCTTFNSGAGLPMHRIPHALTTRCPTLNSLTCAIFPHSPHSNGCTGSKISQLNRAQMKIAPSSPKRELLLFR